jgi:hypothetical protein
LTCRSWVDRHAPETTITFAPARPIPDIPSGMKADGKRESSGCERRHPEDHRTDARSEHGICPTGSAQAMLDREEDRDDD